VAEPFFGHLSQKPDIAMSESMALMDKFDAGAPRCISADEASWWAVPSMSARTSNRERKSRQLRIMLDYRLIGEGSQ
jgi:hypothetical protein